MKNETEIEWPVCPRCGYRRQYMKKVALYCWRLYCRKCDKWIRGWPKRTDKRPQPSHCGKCRYFSETVFEGETANGWGSWYGDCLNEESFTGETRSRYHGCEFGLMKEHKRD